MLLSLLAWGNRQFAPEGRSVEIVHPLTGRPIEPVLADRATGVPLSASGLRVVAGPAANAATRRRMAGRAAETLADRPDAGEVPDAHA